MKIRSYLKVIIAVLVTCIVSTNLVHIMPTVHADLIGFVAGLVTLFIVSLVLHFAEKR